MISYISKKLTKEEKKKIKGRKDFVEKVTCPICGSIAYRLVLHLRSFSKGSGGFGGYSIDFPAEIKTYILCYFENTAEHKKLKSSLLKKKKLLDDAERLAEFFCSKEEFNERRKAYLEREKAAFEKIREEMLAESIDEKMKFVQAKKILISELKKSEMLNFEKVIRKIEKMKE